MPGSEQLRELHIAHGGSAGGTLKHALNLPEGELLDSLDLLSVGPLIRPQTLDEWKTVREQYWRTVVADFDVLSGAYPRDLLSHIETVRRADSVTIWVGTGLSDQIQLVWIPQLLRLLSVDPARLRLIQFTNDPKSGREILSVGELSAEKIKEHPPATPIDSESLAALDAAWAAVTAAEPWPLVNFLARDDIPLPFLRKSLRVLMYRLPDVESGLSYLKTQLLEQVVAQGPTAIRIIGFALIRTMESLDLVGDLSFFAWLKGFASPAAKHPLVTITGNTENLREAKVQITELGRRVLAGEVNAVSLNGIDEWIGGIHLDSAAERVWFQRNGVIVADHRLQPI